MLVPRSPPDNGRARAPAEEPNPSTSSTAGSAAPPPPARTAPAPTPAISAACQAARLRPNGALVHVTTICLCRPILYLRPKPAGVATATGKEAEKRHLGYSVDRAVAGSGERPNTSLYHLGPPLCPSSSTSPATMRESGTRVRPASSSQLPLSAGPGGQATQTSNTSSTPRREAPCQLIHQVRPAMQVLPLSFPLGRAGQRPAHQEELKHPDTKHAWYGVTSPHPGARLGRCRPAPRLVTGIVSAPLWDSRSSTFAGLLTSTDYINVI